MVSALSTDTRLTLYTKRMCIWRIEMDHAGLLLQYYHENRDHLEPWEPQRSPGYYSAEHFEQNTQGLIRLNEDGTAINFVLMQKDKKQVIGVCNFTKISLVPESMCFLGYSISREYQGRGMMDEALGKTIEYVFKYTVVEKIQAACIPHNARSIKLLHRLGFMQDSYRKQYLQINGTLEDHIIFVLNKVF